MSKTFYITTTLPYVNSDPHIGFAMEIIRADIVARSKALQGLEVFFNTGTDEHGQKIYENAKASGKDTKQYVDEYSKKFKELKNILGLKEDLHFIRTTDEHHIKAAQEFWKRCLEAGDIYKKDYKIKYCVGCELEKQDSELVDGKCPLHPNAELEIREEENYFFKFSKYQKPLLDFYTNHPEFVVPDFRFNEIKAFVERGLEDFSISRLRSKMAWGVPVPNDPDHVMYVWFDALVNYVSTLGWPEDENNYEKFWVQGTPVQYCGKDNLRQQSAMWQAMLMSAGLTQSHQIVINGFIQSDGQKMSKSLGNVIDPIEVVKEFGTDGLRYFVAHELSTFEDSDVTMAKIKEAYNSGLANGLGNLASRILTLSEKYLTECPKIPEQDDFSEYFNLLNKFEIHKASEYVWNEIGELDKFIQDKEPFKVVKVDEAQGKELISEMVVRLYRIARLLNPLLPETNMKLKELIKKNKKPEAPLFLRKD